jgi:hypothetical protein
MACVRAAIRLWGHDVQAACEPGGGGYGGVPVHPARLDTHRTSPAQALLTILTETCSTQRLTCSRTATVVCPVCTIGSLRAERGLGGAVIARRSELGFRGKHRVHRGSESLEECHGQAAV